MKYFKNKSKKYLFSIMIVSILSTLLAFSYSNFIFSSNDYRASEMYIGNLLYGIKIDGEATSTISAPSGQTEYTLEITSLNTVSSFYKLIYTTNKNIEVKYIKDVNDTPSGTISNTKTIKVVIDNLSQNKIDIDFDIAAGYITNDLESVTIKEGYTEVKDFYEINDMNILAIYVENQLVTSLDNTEDYKLSKYTCTNNETVTWNNTDKSITVKPITKKTSCTLYFEIANWYELCSGKSTLACKIINAETPISDELVDFGNTSETSGDKGLYYTSGDETEDLTGDGVGETVYYYRGAVENNNVRFGGYCWRIVRTNEDGSVRLRYNGEYADGTCPVTGTDIKINGINYVFNAENDNEKYNEYVYDDGTGESDVKGTIDAWYETSGLINHADKIANVPYCGDKTNPTTPEAGSYTTYTFYGAANRLTDFSGTSIEAKEGAQPIFKCNDADHKYTVSGDTWNGNGKLTYPIGMITADEVSYAGGTRYLADGSSKNNSYYLYTAAHYWTMSPILWDGSSAAEFRVDSTGYLGYSLLNGSTYGTIGVLPAVSLKADVTVAEGTGSYETPYVIN